jgi:hypothetical protein
VGALSGYALDQAKRAKAEITSRERRERARTTWLAADVGKRSKGEERNARGYAIQQKNLEQNGEEESKKKS